MIFILKFLIFFSLSITNLSLMTGKVQGYLSNSKSRLELYRILFNMAMQETIVFDRHILFCVIWSTWIQTQQKWFSFCLISGELWDRSSPCHNAGRWLLPVHCGLHHSEQCHVRSDQKEWSTCLSVTVKEFQKYWLSMNKGIMQRKSHFQSLLWNIFILYIKNNHLLLKKI